MAQWCERWPTTNVARIQSGPAFCHIWDEFEVGSCLAPKVSSFPPFTLQIPNRLGKADVAYSLNIVMYLSSIVYYALNQKKNC